MENKVTSLDELKDFALGEVVELPPFVEGKKFFARVRKPSMLALIKQKQIPNSLLSAAEELFFGKNEKVADIDMDMEKLSEVMCIMAHSALIEPSVKDLESLNLELTDMQIIDLFNYTQEGVKGLESFRAKSKDSECNNDK